MRAAQKTLKIFNSGHCYCRGRFGMIQSLNMTACSVKYSFFLNQLLRFQSEDMLLIKKKKVSRYLSCEVFSTGQQIQHASKDVLTVNGLYCKYSDGLQNRQG